MERSPNATLPTSLYATDAGGTELSLWPSPSANPFFRTAPANVPSSVVKKVPDSPYRRASRFAEMVLLPNSLP
jgi:hypothetical protein